MAPLFYVTPEKNCYLFTVVNLSWNANIANGYIESVLCMAKLKIVSRFIDFYLNLI